jgi:hypothetical protein
LRPYESELVIARKQKEELDAKIAGGSKDLNTLKKPAPVAEVAKKVVVEPKDISGHAPDKKVADWYSKETNTVPNIQVTHVDGQKKSFDWDTDFAKKESLANAPAPAPVSTDVTSANTTAPGNLESKLDQLTESINKLVNARFGADDKKDPGISNEMQELIKRLERAEKENEENKKLIKNLQVNNSSLKPIESIFGQSANAPQIKIDKERKVDINHADPKPEAQVTGNIQITSTSKSIPVEKKAEVNNLEIFNSVVSKDTLDSIVETRNKTAPVVGDGTIAGKKTLTLDELVSKSDTTIKKASEQPKTATLVFPGLNDEKKIDIKNISQASSLRQTLLDDLEFLKNGSGAAKSDETVKATMEEKVAAVQAPVENVILPTEMPTTTYTTNPFKDELMPKTKEERMKALQDKIKALNKSVSVGGKTNISASGLDPYRL